MINKITKLIAKDIDVRAAYETIMGYATAILTSDATAPEDDSTVTIGTKVYTFKTTLTASGATPYEVLIGISAAVALDNLKSAINATAGAGTTYGSGTPAHPEVTATDNTNTTQKIQARTVGITGNAIATTEVSAHLAWGSTHMTQLEVDPGELGSIAAEGANQVEFTLVNVTNTSAVITVGPEELMDYTNNDNPQVQQIGYVPMFECLAPSSSKAMIPYERTFTGLSSYSINLPKTIADRVHLRMKADAAVKVDLYQTISTSQD